MPIQHLSQAGALGPGTDLWILPGIENSTWARKIDWYLNLQMWRASSHEIPILSEDLMTWLKDNEIEPLKISIHPQAPLMIASQQRLPNAEIVSLSLKNAQGSDWIKTAHQVWRQMGSPSVRLFLPANANPDDVNHLWGTDTDKITIGLVTGEV